MVDHDIGTSLLLQCTLETETIFQFYFQEKVYSIKLVIIFKSYFHLYLRTKKFNTMTIRESLFFPRNNAKRTRFEEVIFENFASYLVI